MRFIAFFLTLLLFLIPFQNVSAHLVGQPPFFKVNGVFSNLYPVPTTSLEDFKLPQDIAPDNYLVNQSINFSLELAILPVLPEIVGQTKFSWDFGDGSKGTGLKNTHTYTKPGSYFLIINATYGSDQPQLLQSMLINIIPAKDSQLPKSVIKVNGKQAKDPLTDVLKFNLKNSLQFDGSSSESKSSKIISYLWDFGDQGSSKEPTLTHQYDQKLNQVFPVLRITDENGFISDSYVEIENDQNEAVNNISKIITPSQKPNKLNLLVISGLITLIVLAIPVLISLKKSQKRRH